MLRFLKLTILSTMTISAALATPNETPAQAAEKIMRAWWAGDFETIQANCNPEHPYAQPDYNIQTQIDDINYTKTWIGDLKDIEVERVIERNTGLTTVAMRLIFTEGVYEGGIHLIPGNRFTGFWGPYLEGGGEAPKLDKAQMLEDFDYMVNVLRDTMPHDLAIHDVYGIDVWSKLEEYRSNITGNESLMEFVTVLHDALTACKGHHLFLQSPPWSTDDEWYLQCYAETVPPDAIQTSNNIMQLFSCLPSNNRISPIHFTYWDGNYYTAPEFSIDGTKYHGPFKLLTVDGITPEEVESEFRDKFWSYDIKNKMFFKPDFYSFLPSPASDCRTFRFETPEKDIITLTIPDDAEVDVVFSQNFYSIPKQVIFMKDYNLVYIRVPDMDPDDLQFYEEQLKPVLENEKPRYAVIDIRGNGGGSDAVPERLLQMLCAKPVAFKGILATPANDRVRRYMNARGWDFSDNANLQKIPFLENREFDVRDFYFELEKEPYASVEQVYVIAHNIYSSAGTLVEMAKGNDNVTAIGFPGTSILGMGIDPYYFTLPNSKVTISVEPAIDLSNCKSAAETLHLDTEIELPISAGEYIDYLYRPVPDDCYDYLINEDPFMQQIFVMIKQQDNAFMAESK